MQDSSSHTATETCSLASPSISLTIPTYNESENILEIIKRCRDVLSAYNAEIIVVDDNSPDETWRIAQEAYNDCPDVRVIRRRGETGLATAIARGFRESKNEICVSIDADLQHPPEKILDLIDPLEDGADIVVASRHVDGGGSEGGSKFRRIVSQGAIKLAQLMLPSSRQLADPLAGFFAIRRNIVEGVTLDPRGYKILLEVIVRCNWDEVTEIPYTFTEREHGESKLTAREYINFVEHLTQLAIVDRGFSQFLDPARSVRIVEYGFIGATGVVVNMIVFYFAYEFFGAHYLLAGVAAFLAAVNWNFLGNWTLTFDKPEGSLLHQYLTFCGVCVGGFIVYTGALAIAFDVLDLPALIGNTLAIGAGAVVNFLGAENLAFASTTASVIQKYRNKVTGNRLTKTSDRETDSD